MPREKALLYLFIGTHIMILCSVQAQSLSVQVPEWFLCLCSILSNGFSWLASYFQYLRGNMSLITMLWLFGTCLYQNSVDLGSATSYYCQFNTGYISTYDTALSIMLPLATRFFSILRTLLFLSNVIWNSKGQYVL